jgi:hypothetical protein
LFVTAARGVPRNRSDRRGPPARDERAYRDSCVIFGRLQVTGSPLDRMPERVGEVKLKDPATGPGLAEGVEARLRERGLPRPELAERKAALNEAPVFMYPFAYESEVPVAPSVPYPMKAAHAMEIAFKFDHPETNPDTGSRPAACRVVDDPHREERLLWQQLG